ncbi:MAG: hypothetical protein CM15mV12_1050 [uncultured marine virus]|nr:MAG: hypothetical protein CM15mV12_1050 [uncultured marine virus]
MIINVMIPMQRIHLLIQKIGRAERVVGNGNTAGISTDLYSNDELDLNVDFNVDLADIDDMYAHQFNDYDTMDMDFYEPKRAHYYKYHEEEILKDIEEYVVSNISRTLHRN